MQYKLIAIDMDKTLLTDESLLTERSKEAMEAAEKKGAYVVLATGRMAANVRALVEKLGLNLHSPIICGGGSQVVDKDYNLIYSCNIVPDVAKQVLDFCRDNNIYCQIFEGANFIFKKHMPQTDTYVGISGLTPVEDPDIFEREHVDTPKILIIEDEETIKKLQVTLREKFPMLNIGTSRPTFLELNNPDGNKGVALKVLAEKLGLSRDELIAIGDNQIDASMIEYAGLGAAVGNALPEIKDIADYISADNNNEGVTEVIEKFIINEETL
ncbi:MAG: HAD family phosphatase [Clostridia bacterium]|nr:HAD family phosphatase [Clostridia bacterium]